MWVAVERLNESGGLGRFAITAMLEHLLIRTWTS